MQGPHQSEPEKFSRTCFLVETASVFAFSRSVSQTGVTKEKEKISREHNQFMVWNARTGQIKIYVAGSLYSGAWAPGRKQVFFSHRATSTIFSSTFFLVFIVGNT